MKRFLLLLALIPTMLFAQPDSWVNFKVQYDSWGYQESNFFMVEDTVSGDTAMFHQPTSPYQYLDTTINLNSGNYVVTLTDTWGDGWLSQNPAWFKMSNTCQGLIVNYDPLTMQFFTLDTLVNIWPCAPPTIGCMDPTALNYDSSAGINNYTGQVVQGTSCNLTQWTNNFFGIDLAYYNANQSLFAVGTEISVSGFSYFIDGITTPNNCNQGAALVYVVYDESQCDGDVFGTYMPQALYNDVQVGDNWSINPCEYIYGCNNTLAFNYDSTVTTDDGSCIFITGCMDPLATNYNPSANLEFVPGNSGPSPCTYFVLDTTSCGVDSVELTITIMLDQYAGETSWWVKKNGGQTLFEVFPGDYAGLTMGTIITESFCVADNTPITFRIEDSFGDGLGGAQWGGIDGTWMVYTACDTIGNGAGNFGFAAVANGNVGDCDDLPIEGCMDDNYTEYNPDAVIDNSSCSTLKIYGCIDINSINYDSNANTAEQFSNCDHTLNLTDLSANGWGGSFLIVAQGNNSYGPFTISSGATFTTTLDLNSNEIVKAFFYSDPLSMNFMNECGFEIVSPTGEIIVFGGDNPILNPIQLSPYMYSGIAECLETCIPIVNGCTDISACNYDSTANTLSSCTYNVQYYDCNNQCISDIDGDGVCDELEVVGCQDPLMYNYNILATDSGNCDPFVYGCTDPTMFNYDASSNTDNGSCIAIVNGCTDSTQFNYDPLANTEYTPSNCEPIILGCINSTALNYNALANTDDGSCITYIYGCTDSTMFNYNPLANTDNGTCETFIYGCTNPVALNYDPLANTDDGSCITPIYGCMDSTMYNYNPSANVDNGNCESFVYGCNDPSAFNYDPLANTSDNSCCYIGGCTNPVALNYNVNACYDNNSCILPIVGCTDVSAYNYNPSANISDSTACLFDAGCIGGPGIPYWLNDGCYAWVIDVDDYCCTNTWDSYCQAQYDYCAEGWPVGLDDLLSRDSEIIIYPNPTNGYLYITTKLELEIKLYDMKGSLITENEKVIDMTNLPSGIYNLHIIYEGSTINHKVIKQ